MTPLHPESQANFVGAGNVPSKRRSGLVVTRLGVFVCLLLSVCCATSGEQANNEYQVKAAFLFHFAQLVDWPADSLPTTDNSLFLCTLGEDPFQGALEGTVTGRPVGNRVLRVRHLTQPEGLQECQILFLGKGESKRIPALLATVRAAPVLTVGETSGFLSAGGMICFLLVENKIRFAIDLDTANSAKLKIGSRLLVLAQSVVGEHREK